MIATNSTTISKKNRLLCSSTGTVPGHATAYNNSSGGASKFDLNINDSGTIRESSTRAGDHPAAG
jgi:hypothetical protein